MSYFSVDEQCIMKIEKYVNKLGFLYPLIEHSTDVEIEDGYYGLAITQCITNLYELISKINITEITVKLLPVMQKTKVTRNIASHDYDSVNWSIIKKNCSFILEYVTEQLVRECFEICKNEKGKEKDYTED